MHLSIRNFMANNNEKIPNKPFFWISKRCFDLVICFLMLPLLFIFCILLFFLNIKYNKGSVFYVQERMGINCKPFNVIKFRSMNSVCHIKRGHNDPIEYDRITLLGKFLRKSRIDEFPQILNVIKGEMSLIGPRPDYYEHAKVFLEDIDLYKYRYIIRPGISGLSQIRLGYAEGTRATINKTSIDLYYIKNAGFKLDTKIFLGTIISIIMGNIK